MPPVTVYTTPTCAFCKQTKAFLTEHHVPYTEVNVAANPAAAQEMIAKSGQMGVPVLDIGGTIIVGFDKKAIAQALGLA